jgi:hypothetical protein
MRALDIPWFMNPAALPVVIGAARHYAAHFPGRTQSTLD